MKKYNLNNAGGALISAIFITALAAILATALAVQQQLIIYEGELVTRSDQLYLDLQSLQNIAENRVNRYASQFIVQQASVQPLETQLPTVHLNDMTITGVIENEGGKFNLNNLVYATNQPQFVALMQAVLPSVPQALRVAIAQSITAWMMTGTDDQYYLSLHPAYRSSMHEFADISELKLIKGVTPEIYAALKPIVTAVPIDKPIAGAPPPASGTATPVDINAVVAPVLVTIAPTLNIAQAQSVISCRNGYGAFPSVAAFISSCGKSVGMTVLSNGGVTSNYFLVMIYGKSADHPPVQLKSLLVTQMKKNNTLKVMIGWQEFT